MKAPKLKKVSKEEPKPKHAGGRPTDYTQELADSICHLLSEGKSLRTVCLSEEMPDASTVFRWIRTNDEFQKQYARAKEESADAMFEEITDLGDQAIRLSQEVKGPGANAVVQAVRLKADNLKWQASKMKPKKYGDKVDVTTDGEKITGNTFIVKDFSNDSRTGNK